LPKFICYRTHPLTGAIVVDLLFFQGLPFELGLCEDEITDRDVPLGHGGFTKVHPGAMYLRAKVARVRSYYRQANTTTREKIAIAQSIVDEIHVTGGRFLKKDTKTTGLWFAMTHEQAQEKVCEQACARSHSLHPKKYWLAKKNREQQLE